MNNVAGEGVAVERDGFVCQTCGVDAVGGEWLKEVIVSQALLTSIFTPDIMKCCEGFVSVRGCRV
jgi:hypothetical protein